MTQKNPKIFLKKIKKIQEVQKKVKIKKPQEPKNSKNHFFSKNLKLWKSIFFSKKNPLCFSILGLRNFTIFFLSKPCYSLSFPILGERDSTRTLQSSPFQISGGVGQYKRDGRTDERTVGQTDGNPFVLYWIFH